MAQGGFLSSTSENAQRVGSQGWSDKEVVMAFFFCKGFKSYQPLNSWWAEQNVVARMEFRDGKVPRGLNNCEFLPRRFLVCLMG